jgi:hypothetical protein
MFKKSLAATLLFTTAAFAQHPANTPVTGAADAPKTTTSATERKTTDAAGLGAPAPGSTDKAHVPAAAAMHHHHHHHHPRDVPGAPH